MHSDTPLSRIPANGRRVEEPVCGAWCSKIAAVSSCCRSNRVPDGLFAARASKCCTSVFGPREQPAEMFSRALSSRDVTGKARG